MELFVDILKGLPNFYHLNGATDDEIAKSEQLLCVSFAPEYKAYVSAYGVASANGHELTGICTSQRLNVVNVTLSCRKQLPEADTLYVIEEANIDGIVLWQSATGEIYQSSSGKKLHKVCDSLREYITMN